MELQLPEEKTSDTKIRLVDDGNVVMLLRSDKPLTCPYVHPAMIFHPVTGKPSQQYMPCSTTCALLEIVDYSKMKNMSDRRSHYEVIQHCCRRTMRFYEIEKLEKKTGPVLHK